MFSHFAPWRPYPPFASLIRSLVFASLPELEHWAVKCVQNPWGCFNWCREGDVCKDHFSLFLVHAYSYSWNLLNTCRSKRKIQTTSDNWKPNGEMSFSACCRTLAVSILKPRLDSWLCRCRCHGTNRALTELHLGSKLTVISCIPQHVRKPCKLSRHTCKMRWTMEMECVSCTETDGHKSTNKIRISLLGTCVSKALSYLAQKMWWFSKMRKKTRSKIRLWSFGIKFCSFEIRNGGLWSDANFHGESFTELSWVSMERCDMIPWKLR